VAARGQCFIGTSGWSYDHWAERFYPPALPAYDRLAFYARHFQTVEINATFYRLPEPATVLHWKKQTPASFRFAVKASQFITHMKKLKDPQASLPPFLTAIEGLGKKCGPVLFQLPPHWHVNLDRLTAFLKALPAGYRYAFEFRERSWYDDRVFTTLADYAAALCIHDLAGCQSPVVTTADFIYLRLHGPDDPYRGKYGKAALRPWAGLFARWNAQGRDVYTYFNNDEKAHAIADALALKELVVAASSVQQRKKAAIDLAHGRERIGRLGNGHEHKDAHTRRCHPSPRRYHRPQGR
jgi:uncharacterized protein YecE (DUF72 family)